MTNDRFDVRAADATGASDVTDVTDASDANDAAGDPLVAADSAAAAKDPVRALSGEVADGGRGAADGTDSDSRAPALLIGVIAVVLGAVVLADAARIHAPAGQSFVGPAAFPVGVGILLIVTGGVMAGTRAMASIRASRTSTAGEGSASAGSAGGGSASAGSAGGGSAGAGSAGAGSAGAGSAGTSPDRAVRAARRATRMRQIRRVAALLGLLIGYAVLLPRLSYVFSTAALFSGAALLFGSGHRLRTVVIGIVLAAITFVGFSRGIGVSLPAGPWGF
jgi:tripartite tricarboxylate transporter TctB family protein